MRLNTLNKHDRRTAQAILAAAALAQDGAPYRSAGVEKYAEEIKELLGEIEAHLALSPNDKHYSQKVNRYLSDQVVDQIMGSERVADVKARLGEQGRLPISGYKIRFGKDALKQSKESERFIRKAISSATDVQHITAKGAPQSVATRGMTLIVIPQATNGIDHWLLVDAIRTKDELVVTDIYRVMPTVVDLSDVGSPLEMLRAFTEVYGAEFRLEDLPVTKMVEQVEIAKHESQLSYTMDQSDDDIQVSVTGFSVTFGGQNTVLSGKSISFIVAAYAVNWTKYRKDRVRFLGK